MGEFGVLILLYGAAVLVLVAEIFIPSSGVLSITGVGFLVAAVVKTFHYCGDTVGYMAAIASPVFLLVFAVLSIKVWPHTRIGRIIAPPNPEYTKKDLGTDTEDINPLVGTYGRALSPLRPVGTCEFDGRRFQCICESGMIDAGAAVRAVGLRGRNLEVAVTDDQTAV